MQQYLGIPPLTPSLHSRRHCPRVWASKLVPKRNQSLPYSSFQKFFWSKSSLSNILRTAYFLSVCLISYRFPSSLVCQKWREKKKKKKKRERKTDQCKRDLPQGYASQRSLTNSTLPVQAEILTNLPITNGFSYFLNMSPRFCSIDSLIVWFPCWAFFHIEFTNQCAKDVQELFKKKENH